MKRLRAFLYKNGFRPSGKSIFFSPSLDIKYSVEQAMREFEIHHRGFVEGLETATTARVIEIATTDDGYEEVHYVAWTVFRKREDPNVQEGH